VLALSLGLSTPAWAIWDGIEPMKPIMPRWTWQGIENQERLRDLTPEQANRLRRMPSDQREQALEEMSRENRGTTRGSAGMHERMRHMPTEEQERPEDEQMRRSGESEREPGEMRHEGETTAPESEMRQDETGTEREMRRDESEMRREETRTDTEAPERDMRQDEMRQPAPSEQERSMRRETSPSESQVRQDESSRTSADGNAERVDVELKPVPKSGRPPTPGETTVISDNPIDEAGAHLGMARTSAKSEDWAATKGHLRQAEEALDQIVAKGNRNAERYLDRLKGEIRDTEKAVDKRARDLDIRIENLERSVRHLKPEER
jgi:hypothetical protein